MHFTCIPPLSNQSAVSFCAVYNIIVPETLFSPFPVRILKQLQTVASHMSCGLQVLHTAKLSLSKPIRPFF